MNKTQIQVPEALFAELKAFAKAREWSLAETFRRGAELLLEVYPDHNATLRTWTPPVSGELGWKGLSPDELRELALRDAEHSLPA